MKLSINNPQLLTRRLPAVLFLSFRWWLSWWRHSLFLYKKIVSGIKTTKQLGVMDYPRICKRRIGHLVVQILYSCWRNHNHCIPQIWMRPTSLLFTRTSRQECNNCRRIDLLNIAGKILPLVPPLGLHTIANQIFPEVRFSLRSLYNRYGILTKATAGKKRWTSKPITFVNVIRSGLFAVVQGLGMTPENLL